MTKMGVRIAYRSETVDVGQTSRVRGSRPMFNDRTPGT